MFCHLSRASMVQKGYLQHKVQVNAKIPEELPEIQINSQPLSSQNSVKSHFSGFLNFHFHKQRHIYLPKLPQSKYTSYVKLGFALISLGFTAFAGYNYHRSADLTELQLGVITHEEYNLCHPKTH